MLLRFIVCPPFMLRSGPDDVLEPSDVPTRGAPAGWMDCVEYVEEPWAPYTVKMGGHYER